MGEEFGKSHRRLRDWSLFSPSLQRRIAIDCGWLQRARALGQADWAPRVSLASLAGGQATTSIEFSAPPRSSAGVKLPNSLELVPRLTRISRCNSCLGQVCVGIPAHFLSFRFNRLAGSGHVNVTAVQLSSPLSLLLLDRLPAMADEASALASLSLTHVYYVRLFLLRPFPVLTFSHQLLAHSRQVEEGEGIGKGGKKKENAKANSTLLSPLGSQR